ncbi:hypothetical protein ACIQXI_07815 [Lysinibacillus sp. NPDC097195]|uniref:hypothetical protein n=1 Tax=Lysinibacillus sp. NPDC097195 TaxID=3364141 RepID=UPI00381952D6
MYKVFTALFAFACILFISNSSASATTLSQQEKEQLHQQYIEILEEVKSTVTWGEGLVSIEVSPIEDFEEEAWVSLEVFRQRAIETTQSSVVDITFIEFEEDWGSEEVFNHKASAASQTNAITTLSNSITPFSSTSRVRHDSTPVDITVSANFTTQLAGNRQIFASYSNLRNTASEGHFNRTGVNARITRLGSNYEFTIGGNLNYLGFTTNHTLNTNFICLPNGVVL